VFRLWRLYDSSARRFFASAQNWRYADTERSLMPEKKFLGRKPTPKRRRKRLTVAGPNVSFARSGQGDHCSMPLTAQSQERAQQEEKDGDLSTLEGKLTCECGARVGARRRPWMDGPKGGPLAPTLHYPRKAPRPPARKRGPEKRIR
jgi:hypothetical protein